MDYMKEIEMHAKLQRYKAHPYRYRYDKITDMWQVFRLRSVITDGPHITRIKSIDIIHYDMCESEIEAIERTLKLNNVELKIRPYENKLIRD